MSRPTHPGRRLISRLIIGLLPAALLVAGLARPSAAIDERPKLVRAESLFAFELYRRLASSNPDVNLIVSPYALVNALEPMMLAARGRTRTELATTLRINLTDLPPTQLRAAARTAREELGETTNDFVVRVANVLFTRATVTDEFKRLATDFGLTPKALAGSGEAARQLLNSAVVNAAGPAVGDVFTSPVDASTRVVMASSLLFRATWVRRLSTSGTMAFTRPDGRTVNPRRLTTGPAGGTFNTFRATDYRAVVLPYRGARLATVVVLPEPGRFNQVESSFRVGTLSDVLLQSRRRTVSFDGPAFNIRLNIDLADLAVLGAPSLFERGTADLTGAVGRPGQGIDIGLHQVTFRFDSDGTEEGESAPPATGPAAEESFVLNRPFLFWVVDRPTGTVLFTGRVVDPTA